MSRIDFESKNFTVSDHRDSAHSHNRGIYITAGHGDGLYCLNEQTLIELRTVVDKILEMLKKNE